MPIYILSLSDGDYRVEFQDGHPETVKIRRRYMANGLERHSWTTIFNRAKHRTPGPFAATAIRTIYAAQYEQRTPDAYLQPAPPMVTDKRTGEAYIPVDGIATPPELETPPEPDSPPGLRYHIRIRHPKTGDPTRERFGFVATEMRWLDKHLNTDGPRDWRAVNTIRRNNAADTERETRAVARDELRRLFVAPKK